MSTTDGLEVVAWWDRRLGGATNWEPPSHTAMHYEPLVTLASAQAAVAAEQKEKLLYRDAYQRADARITLSREDAQKVLDAVLELLEYQHEDYTEARRKWGEGNPHRWERLKAQTEQTTALVNLLRDSSALAQPAGYTDADCLASEERWGASIAQTPIYVRRDQLQKAQQSPFLCELSMEPRQDRVPLYTDQQAPARELSDAEIIAIGHRKATKYTHRSDPMYCSHGFVNYTLIDFTRAVLAASQEPQKLSKQSWGVE